MAKGLIVIGELHQDLLYETEIFDNVTRKIAKALTDFIKYNPDDLNSRIIENLVKKAISKTPKKNLGIAAIKRGGNGNNSAEYLTKLGIPVKLISTVGKDAKWMLAELEEMGINTDDIILLDEITPVSTIIKSDFTTKILISSNLKEKMKIDSTSIKNNSFQEYKIAFSTPITEKFIKILEKCQDLDLITAFTVERQNVRFYSDLMNIIRRKFDILFINHEDARDILGECQSVEEIDIKYKNFASIRVYTAGREGSHLFTDNFNFASPALKLEGFLDRTGAGDCFAAGFLLKVHDLVENKQDLLEKLEKKNLEKLKPLLQECVKFATFSASYKISKQVAPTLDELDKFIKENRIN